MIDAVSTVLEVRYQSDIAAMTMTNLNGMNAFNWETRTTMYERRLEIEANESCRVAEKRKPHFTGR